VARAGACTPAEVKVGQIRPAPSGVHSAWVQCPLASANKIAGVGRVKVGWVVARATLLTQRPLQCFRCLERGHVRERCTSLVDRSGMCYRCGKPGHVARACTAQNGSCPACQAAGLPFGHKIGAPACKAGANKRRGGGKPNPPSPKTVQIAPLGAKMEIAHIGATTRSAPLGATADNAPLGAPQKVGDEGEGTPSTENTERALPRIISVEVLPSIPCEGVEGMEVKALEDGKTA